MADLDDVAVTMLVMFLEQEELLLAGIFKATSYRRLCSRIFQATCI